MAENLSFGYWVRRRRKALDLTQAELGRRAGASAAMIRKIEADERRPSRELAEALADHLALPPSEREAFLRAARDIQAVDQLALTGSPPPALPPSSLPAPVTSLVNRVAALAEVSALLLQGNVRLLTLIGPPGMGKTRLSIQVGRQILPYFSDGAWFVDLSAISDPARVLPAIALALGLPPAPGHTPAQRVHLALRDRRLLLVLDNLEQISADAALTLAELLRACPGVKVLATSRLRLDIYGEHEYLLPPMTLPPLANAYDPADLWGYEAVQLFVDRARQHDPHFALTPETAVSVAQICRQMDGLPLALELAAARTRQMSVGDLAAALREASGRDWHALLHSSARDLPPRQQTLFNAVAWSYSLLAPPQQAFLRHLGAFEGGFDAWAADAVCLEEQDGGETAVLAMLDLLVDHNLVSLQSRRPQRWRLLEMIREFALSELAADERQAVKARHGRHFADRQRDWGTGWEEPAYLQAIDADLDNYRAALQTALEMNNAVLAAQLGTVLGFYWERRGLLYEGRLMLGRILTLPGEVEPQQRFPIFHSAANLAWMQHDFAAAERIAGEALELTRGNGLHRYTAAVLNLLGRIYMEQARYAEADEVILEAIELSRSLTPPRPADFELIQRGEAALAQGDLDRAHRLTMEGLAAVSESDLIPFCVGWNNLAIVALTRGDTGAAREALRRFAPLAHLHARRSRIFLTTVAGLLLADPPAAREQVKTAVRLLSYVVATNERLGDPLSPFMQERLARQIAAAKTQLSAMDWNAAWEEGRRCSQDEALVTARQAL